MQNKKEDNFSEWFLELTKEAELYDDRYNVKGAIVYREWAALSMKKMYNIYESELERTEHYPLFMPVLIPESNFYKESEHVEGFTPEVFWVTSHGKDGILEEKLALRPTSETAFHSMYSYWIRSYDDLPFRRYQSGSVYRYETKATRPFFRGREFFWIETHTAHRDEKSAREQVLSDMKTTYLVLQDKFAMPFIFFRRPEWDKFAGAVDTYAADVIMPSGRVLQLPSTHYLGTKFSKAFDVKFMDSDSEEKYVHLTCYGPAISRIYGGIIAFHSDNRGLRMPFEITPKQVVVVPLLFKGKDNDLVLNKANEIYKLLSEKYGVILDDKTSKTPGEKFNIYELKGIPIRIEIGPRDIENKKVTFFRRDLNEKYEVDFDMILNEVKKIELEFTQNLLKSAMKVFEDCIVDVSNLNELKSVIDRGKIARFPFVSRDRDGEEFANIVKEKTGAEIRGTKMDELESVEGKKCAISGKIAKVIVYAARSY